MKTISRSHYALNICVGAAILAGCGGSAQFPNPIALGPVANSNAADRLPSPSKVVPERVGSDSSSTERLTGTAKLIKPCHSLHGKDRGGWGTHFSASGVATGPNPGTFTATGTWTGGGLPQPQWSFSESFSVTSGSQTINGTILAFDFGFAPFSCTAVKKDSFSYSTPMVGGNAKVNIWSGHFREDLLSF